MRQRESGPDIEDREQREATRQTDAAPHQDAVRRIPGQRPARIGPNDGVLDVAEKPVEVVEVPDRRRTRVRGDDLIAAVKLVAPGNLGLAVTRAAVCPKHYRTRDGIDHWLEAVFALPVADSHEQVLHP